MKVILKISVLIISSLIFHGATAQYASVSSYKMNSTKNIEKIDFTEWSTLLRRNISVLGTINYTGFKKDKNSFDRFVRVLANTKITNNWTQDERKAYWVNVYNTFSVKLITDTFPVRSITELDKPFRKEFFEINGEMMSLNDVEEILKSFSDARLLLVINKNSKSGVRLIKRAYTANNLDEMLNKRVRLFIRNKEKNRITFTEMKLSPLLKEYEKEIVSSFGSIENFITKYSDVPSNRQVITYLEFEEKINSYQAYGE